MISAWFSTATQQLKQAIQRSPIVAQEFTHQQYLDIMAEKAKITDLTWHHHQDGVSLELVNTSEHAATGHTGGRALTGVRP